MWTVAKVEEHVRWVRDQLQAGTLPGELHLGTVLYPREDDCGIVACIGGWCVWREFGHSYACVNDLFEMINAIEREDERRSSALSDLLFGFTYKKLPHNEVIHACDRWLAGETEIWG